MSWLLPDGEQRVTPRRRRAGRRRQNLVGAEELINVRNANVLRIFRKQICDGSPRRRAPLTGTTPSRQHAPATAPALIDLRNFDGSLRKNAVVDY